MSVADDLKTVADDLTTLQGVVAAAVSELATPVASAPSVGDTVLEALVAALTTAGYTVTAPEAEVPAEEATEPTEEAA